ncbi:class I SAM-dependent methyltransferase [Streptomyces sp. NRRL B-24572]|uniref:class I SAM-dependent methyltransferase n=1 Tax=Streptomyces sp. NRRL B-24572 TaxID=1962156 RepID=UPI000A398F42|nr:methyltransferase domain-containing protein [Streptomyces sp. NRRL B-24572]
MTHAADPDSAYLLGHSSTETDRLLLQDRPYDPITEQPLLTAGLRPGMRALDVGCGAGDVTFLAARIVGSTGSVTGVDAAPRALEVARARAAGRKRDQAGDAEISFRPVTLPDVTIDLGGPVGAVIGRLILGHLPDLVMALRRLSRPVRPGGLVVFQDLADVPLRGEPPTPLNGAVLEGIGAARTVNGSGPGEDARLYPLFRRAGPTAPALSATTPMGGAEGDTVPPLVVTHAERQVL